MIIAKQWNDAQKEDIRLTKDVKELKRNHKAELEDGQKEAKDHCEACQKLQEELNGANKKLDGVEDDAKERCRNVAK
uniref:Uncharacterized protein n=1 Tax=Cannabis sativa TaxID=3483 RepID=A0A803P9N8_CANSA